MDGFYLPSFTWFSKETKKDSIWKKCLRKENNLKVPKRRLSLSTQINKLDFKILFKMIIN